MMKHDFVNIFLTDDKKAVLNIKELIKNFLGHASTTEQVTFHQFGRISGFAFLDKDDAVICGANTACYSLVECKLQHSNGIYKFVIRNCNSSILEGTGNRNYLSNKFVWVDRATTNDDKNEKIDKKIFKSRFERIMEVIEAAV